MKKQIKQINFYIYTPVSPNRPVTPGYADHSTAHATELVELMLTQCWLSFLPQHDAEVQLPKCPGLSSPAQNLIPAYGERVRAWVWVSGVGGGRGDVRMCVRLGVGWGGWVWVCVSGVGGGRGDVGRGVGVGWIWQ
jgi:hypothetical protein